MKASTTPSHRPESRRRVSTFVSVDAGSVGATTFRARSCAGAASGAILTMRTWTTAAAIGCLLASSPASGLDSTLRLTQYRHTAWRVQDGSLTAVPNAIAQTSDGYIWIGTGAGLVKDHGVRFAPWTAPGQATPFSAVVLSLLAVQTARCGSARRRSCGVSRTTRSADTSAAASTPSSKIVTIASGSRDRVRRIPAAACARRTESSRAVSAATTACVCRTR